MLTLEIEWLMGVCFAARDQALAAPEWPVEPDRVYSALVASWGMRALVPDTEEREALEWLENQPAPDMAAAGGGARTTVTSFVPPNDPSPSDIRVLPERRRRQPRQFPATRLPAEPCHMQLTWRDEPPAGVMAALERLAARTSYIGHSSSVVRCRFVAGSQALHTDDGLSPHVTAGAPYPGRLAELERLFQRFNAGDERARPRRSQRMGRISPKPGATEGLFADRWIILADAGGQRPDLRDFAVIARIMRAALMEAVPDPMPEWISGHAADGSPSRDAHLAIVPLANVGWQHSDGSLMGLALVPPRVVAARWASATPAAFEEEMLFRQALVRLAGKTEEIELYPQGTNGTPLWRLSMQVDDTKRSLRSDRYLGLFAQSEPRAARRWTTVTPIALDRHPKAKGEDKNRRKADELEQIEATIADACANIGLPKPEHVTAHKHSTISAAPSAWPAGGSPDWQRWSLPKSLAGRRLTHATITFAEPVRGPVILGAGRFLGLGLCLPLRDHPEAEE